MLSQRAPLFNEGGEFVPTSRTWGHRFFKGSRRMARSCFRLWHPRVCGLHRDLPASERLLGGLRGEAMTGLCVARDLIGARRPKSRIVLYESRLGASHKARQEVDLEDLASRQLAPLCREPRRVARRPRDSTSMAARAGTRAYRRRKGVVRFSEVESRSSSAIRTRSRVRQLRGQLQGPCGHGLGP